MGTVTFTGAGRVPSFLPTGLWTAPTEPPSVNALPLPPAPPLPAQASPRPGHFSLIRQATQVRPCSGSPPDGSPLRILSPYFPCILNYSFYTYFPP